MIFETFEAGWFFLMTATLAIALVFGATAKQTNFCTMGAISDYVNFEDTGRLRAWTLALAVGILIMGFFEYFGYIDLSMSFPNYRSPNFIWLENIIGGLIFGVAMTYASGCGNKTLVRVGEGDINSVITATSLGIAAYYMVNPLPIIDQSIFEFVFYDWLRPLAVELTHDQDVTSILLASMPSITEIISPENLRVTLTTIFASILLYAVFRNKIDTRNVVGGIVIGLAVSIFWLMTNNVFIDVDEEKYMSHEYLNEWEMVHEPDEDNPSFLDNKPKNANSFRPQSFTFVNPVGNTFAITKTTGENLTEEDPDNKTSIFLLLNMGVMAVIGVALGSFFASIISKTFKFKLNYSMGAILKSIVAGIFMGIGGILAIGCTIGQGITGASTLSFGSILALISIIIGSYITQKVIYWNLMRD